MAHYAELNDENRVINVIPGIDESQGDGEKIYQEFTGNRWKRTSYNTYAGKHKNGGTPFRKNFAGIGMYYDETRDAFIPKKPFDSWVLNEETCLYESPIPYPNDGKQYKWNESTVSWVLDVLGA
jgi:hypothetical protein